jgi:1-acyl-sn-glycerol-3-phosphate acyltransferase
MALSSSPVPPIAPGLPRKEFQAMLERMISEESEKLVGEGEAKVARS